MDFASLDLLKYKDFVVIIKNDNTRMGYKRHVVALPFTE